MFRVAWMPEAKERYAELRAKAKARFAARQKSGKKKKSKDEGLFAQVHKAVSLLSSNPRHRSLQTHEYKSLTNPYDASKKVFEAYAQSKTPGAYRVFWCYGPKAKDITIIAITPHP